MRSMFSRILVGVDGSKESFRALDCALELAKHVNGSVDALYSIPSRVYSELADREVRIEEPSGDVRFISMLQQEENNMRDLIIEAGIRHNIPVEFHTRVGDPVESIVEFISSSGIDLVVVGSSGKGMADRLILGSVSTGVVHKSPVPVLVLKPSV